jgi:hypothetical protein
MKMYRTCVAALVLHLLLGAGIHAANGQEQPKDRPASSGAEAEAAHGIDPKVQSEVRKLAEHLTSLERFRVEVLAEQLPLDGEEEFPFELRSSFRIRVERPNKFALVGEAVEVNGLQPWVAILDGEEFSQQFGTQYWVEPMNDLNGLAGETLRKLEGGFGVLAALMSDQPTKVLLKNVGRADYVGLQDTDGVECHHLKLFHKYGVWQWDLWIDAGDHPLPRRWVLRPPRREGVKCVYKFTEWNSDPRFDAEDFQFTPSPDAIKIDPPIDPPEVR